MNNRINKPAQGTPTLPNFTEMPKLTKEDEARLESLHAITAEQFLEREKSVPKVHLSIGGADQKHLIAAITTSITGHPGFTHTAMTAICFQCVALQSIEAGVKKFFEVAGAHGAKFPEFAVPLFVHFIGSVYPELDKKP